MSAILRFQWTLHHGIGLDNRLFAAIFRNGSNSMFKVAIDAHWQLRRQDGTPLVPRLTALLVGIQQTGTLAAACRTAGLTYRYAWGLLRDGERAFGHSLVASQRGRGAKLTPPGER